VFEVGIRDGIDLPIQIALSPSMTIDLFLQHLQDGLTPALKAIAGFLGVGKSRPFSFSIGSTIITLTKCSKNWPTSGYDPDFLGKSRFRPLPERQGVILLG
jgi:hypothetical protein